MWRLAATNELTPATITTALKESQHTVRVTSIHVNANQPAYGYCTHCDGHDGR